MREGCCFTGHRIIPAAVAGPLENALADAVRRACLRGIREFYAGGAIGFDMLAEETVLRAKAEFPDLRLHLILPCRDQADRWQSDLRRRYAKILSAADSVKYVSLRYCPGVMAARNRELVNAASHCIAYLSHPGGGTAQTVAMAESAGLTVENLAEVL